MRGWVRVLVGGLLLCAVAAAGIGLNFTLLHLTGDVNDPVGRLSPRAVFIQQSTEVTPTRTGTTSTTPEPTPTTTEPVVTDDGGPESDDHDRGSDDDD